MSFPNLSEVQRERADLGNYAFNQWVRRRFRNPNNAAIAPASHHPSNTPNVYRLSDRELYLRRRYRPLIHFMAAQVTTSYDENAVRNWNRQLLEYSIPEEDLYYWYNSDPNQDAPRATPAGKRPVQEPTTISHQQPQGPTPRRALETRRLPGGITMRHTEVVKIRQSADGPTRFFSPRTGYEALTRLKRGWQLKLRARTTRPKPMKRTNLTRKQTTSPLLQQALPHLEISLTPYRLHRTKSMAFTKIFDGKT